MISTVAFYSVKNLPMITYRTFGTTGPSGEQMRLQEAPLLPRRDTAKVTCRGRMSTGTVWPPCFDLEVSVSALVRMLGRAQHDVGNFQGAKSTPSRVVGVTAIDRLNVDD